MDTLMRCGAVDTIETLVGRGGNNLVISRAARKSTPGDNASGETANADIPGTIYDVIVLHHM